MNGRTAKKMRKLVAEGAHNIEVKVLAQMDERFRNMLKPKPQWMPRWLWRWVTNQVIKKEPFNPPDLS